MARHGTPQTAPSNVHAVSHVWCEDQTDARRGKFVELLEASQQPVSARVRKTSQRWIHPTLLEQGCLARRQAWLSLQSG